MSEQWKGLHYHDRHVTAAPFGWKKRALAAEAPNYLNGGNGQ